ncbi:transposable element Tcb1 transposase [Trichonephila clavipes]|nr:transposable element Tcb1 transposase [Trichonephila clavipes]
MWNVTYWQNVVFSDESRFVLGTDDNRAWVWRRPGEWYNSSHIVLRHTARTAGVMVWGAIAYDSRSTLIVMSGTLMGQRYVDDILRPHVGNFLNGVPGAIFQQDNARPHTARVAQDFLRHFQTLPWPARSPDLSPVQHVWDQLKRQMPLCHSVHDLELAVQDLWGSSASGQLKHSPVVFLIQETHLRTTQHFNIANYYCYKKDRIANEKAYSGTLIPIKYLSGITVSPPLQAIDAPIVIITLPDDDPISIVSIHIPPKFDEHTFAIDLNNLFQTSRNCVVVSGDFNATPIAWNCNTNFTKRVYFLNVVSI